MTDLKAGLTFTVIRASSTLSELENLKRGLLSVGNSADQVAKKLDGAFQDQGGKWRDAKGKFLGVGSALNEATKYARALQGALSEAAGILSRIGLVVGGATAGLAYGIFSAAKSASLFDQELIAVKNISGATAGELNNLRVAALNAGLATKFSPQQAVEGLRMLAQMGFNAKEGIAALNPVLNIAMASMGDLGLADSAFLAAQSVKAFGTSFEEIPLNLDKMTKATNVFAIQMKDLPKGIGITARGAQAMNQTLDETLIAFGLVKNVIPGVERAATGTAVAFERLTNVKRQNKLESYFGVKAVDAETGKFRDFLDVAVDMIDKTKDMSEAKKSAALGDIFGERGAGAINAILTQLTNGVKTSTGEILKGADAVAYLRNTIGSAAGTTEKLREEMFNTFEGQMQLLEGVLQTMQVVFGDAFSKVFKPFAKGLVDGLTLLTQKFEAMPQGIKTAVAAVGLLAVAGGALLTVALGLGVALAGVAAIGFKALAIAGGAITIMLQQIIFWGGAAAVAFGAVALAWRSNFGGIQDRVETFKATLTGLFEVITNYKDGITSMSAETADALSRVGVLDFVLGVGGVLGSLKQFFVEAFEIAGTAGGHLLARLAPLSDAVGDLVDVVMDLGGQIFEAFFGAPAQLDGTVMSMEGVAKVAFGVANALGDMADGAAVAIRWVKELWKEIGPDVVNLVKVSIAGVSEAWDAVVDAYDAVVSAGRVLGDAFGDLGAVIDDFVAKNGVTQEASTTTAKSFDWLNVAAFVLRFGIIMVRKQIEGVTAAIEFAGNAVRFLADAFSVVVNSIRLAVQWLKILGGGTIDVIVAKFDQLKAAVSFDKDALYKAQQDERAILERMDKEAKVAWDNTEILPSGGRRDAGAATVPAPMPGVGVGIGPLVKTGAPMPDLSKMTGAQGGTNDRLDRLIMLQERQADLAGPFGTGFGNNGGGSAAAAANYGQTAAAD